MNALDLSQDDRLKPCPFCNSSMRSFAGMTPDAFAKCSAGGFSVCCDCGAIGPTGETMVAAVEAWNRRHEEQPSEFERCMK